MNSALLQAPFPTGDSQTGIELHVDPKFHAVFAGDLPDAQSGVLRASQRPIAASAFDEPNGALAWKKLPSWAVVATGDKAAGANVVLNTAQRTNAGNLELEGNGFLMPPGTAHNALDLGPDTGQMLSTYIVEPDEPLASFVDVT